ncbi:MAG TPA: hypothetical protein VNO86_07845 [Candidatus Binatia bacterium]|nr:hypothetical protein [Candidatus Binatia bacterium]
MAETQSGEDPKAPAGEGSAEEFAWRGADTAAGSASGDDGEAASRAKGKEWLAQLEQMIESLATQAAPVIREVGAKAAELAALAAEKAGPIAHRAAELTEVAGAKVAERSRHLAEELRGERQGSGGGTAGAETPEAASGEAEAPGGSEGTAAEERERSA